MFHQYWPTVTPSCLPLWTVNSKMSFLSSNNTWHFVILNSELNNISCYSWYQKINWSHRFLLPSMQWVVFFLECLKQEVLPCIHTPVSHLRRRSVVCQQGKNKADLVCCTQGMGKEADRQHTALTAAARHPHIKVECVASSYTLLISYPAVEGSWRQQGKLQRTQNSALAGALASPGPPSPAGDTFRDWHEKALLNCITLQKQVFIISSPYSHVLDYPWVFAFPQDVLCLLETASSQAQERMSCPSCTLGHSSPASLWVHSNTPFLLMHKPTQLPGVTCSGGTKPGWLHQFSRGYSERKSGFGWKTPFSVWKGHTIVCFFQYGMFLMFSLWLNLAVSRSTYKHSTIRGSCSAFLDLGNYTKSAILQGAGMSQKCTLLYWESATKASVSATSFQLQVLYR